MDENGNTSVNYSRMKQKDDGLTVKQYSTTSETAPFLVIFDTIHQNNSDQVTCTGSLVSPLHVITPAHCIDYFPRDSKGSDAEQCLKVTKLGRLYRTVLANNVTIKLQCRQIATMELGVGRVKSLVIQVMSPKSIVWFGIKNMLKRGLNSKFGIVKHAVQPPSSYKGSNGNGPYRGYDIGLLELERSAVGIQPACLPSPNFKEKGGLMAGYGIRGPHDLLHETDVCQTNSYGYMKYHYCSSKCDIHTKAPRSEECKTFFTNSETPNGVPESRDEILIIDKGKRNFCFRDQNKEDDSKVLSHLLIQ